MRLPEDVWVRTLGFCAAHDAARVASAAPAQRSAVARAVTVALGGPGSTRDLYVAELRSGCTRVARTKDNAYYVLPCGALFEFDGVHNAPMPRCLAAGGVRIVSISAGHDYVMALSDSGQLWSMGEGDHGQLGHGDRVARNFLSHVEALADCFVVNVSCGYHHSWAVTREGGAYYWGHIVDVLDCDEAIPGEHGAPLLIRPMRVQVPTGARIVSACGGYNSAFLVSQDGRLFGCGKNSDGELGVGDQNSHTSGMVVVPIDGVVKVSTVHLSEDDYLHTLALTSSGNLFGFGSNHYGQLAIGENVDYVRSPQRIVQPALVGITDICAMAEGSFVITGGQQLYTFGKTSPEFSWDSDEDEPSPAPRPFLLPSLSTQAGEMGPLLSVCAGQIPFSVHHDPGKNDMLLLAASPGPSSAEQLCFWKSGATEHVSRLEV